MLLCQPGYSVQNTTSSPASGVIPSPNHAGPTEPVRPGGPAEQQDADEGDNLAEGGGKTGHFSESTTLAKAAAKTGSMSTVLPAMTDASTQCRPSQRRCGP